MQLPIDTVRMTARASTNRIGLAVGRRAASSEEFEKMEADILALTKACNGATTIFQNEVGEFVNAAQFAEAAKDIITEPMTEVLAATFVDANAMVLGVEPPITRKFLRVGPEYSPVLFTPEGTELDAQWSPQYGSQELFLRAPLNEVEILYEGTRGPGKTDALLMDFAQEVGKGYGAEWRGLLLRQTHPQLRDVLEKAQKWIPRIWPGAVFNQVKSMWQWPTGEQLYFSHFNSPSQYSDYHGHSYPWIGWEELTTWPSPDCYRLMFSCSRSTIVGMPRKVRATTNPYGVGHGWVKARFRRPNTPGKILGPLIEGGKDERGNIEPVRRAIHGYLDENKLLMMAEPEYRGKIVTAARNSSELAAWLDGSWDIVAGGMFDDIWSEYRDTIVMQPFDIPRDWKIYRAYDHGSSKPFAVGWFAVSNGDDLLLRNGKVRATVRGDIYHVKEWYGWRVGQRNEGSRMLIADIARGIVEREIQWGFRSRDGSIHRITRGPADTSIFDDVNGVSVASEFEKSVMIGNVRHMGVHWEKADKGPGSRKQGWEVMRSRFKATKRPDGGTREKPGLFITTDCEQFLQTVPVLPRDERDPDDVNSDAEDHIGDMARYFLRFDTLPTMRSYSMNDTARGVRGRRATT